MGKGRRSRRTTRKSHNSAAPTSTCDSASYGGYDATSISALRLFGTTSRESVACLDACIEPIWEMFNMNPCLHRTGRTIQNFPMERAGKEGQQWHIATIRMAIKHSGSSLYLKKQLVLNGGCKALLTSGAFLIDGHLGERERHHEEKKPSEDTWRRSIAVKDGLVFGRGLDTTGVPISTLCLDENGHPDHDRGYMVRFLKVYKVQEHVAS
jgi:hypothetical protein